MGSKRKRKDNLLHGYKWINENKTAGTSRPVTSPRTKPANNSSRSSNRSSSGRKR